MGLRFLLAILVPALLLSPARAFEVEEGQCSRILSGQSPVRIHYSTGLKAEVYPVDRDDVIPQIDVTSDGQRKHHKWVGGGGLIPLENPQGRFVYADKEATKLVFKPGETRHLPFAFHAAGGATRPGSLAIAVERVDKRAFGKCQATFVAITTSVSWGGAPPASKISRMFVKELGFFVSTRIETTTAGKLHVLEFAATHIELLR